MSGDIVERLRYAVDGEVHDALDRMVLEAADEITRLRAEVERMQTALDAIYNHNEAARAAVIQHYGLWHNTALKEHTNGR